MPNIRLSPTELIALRRECIDVAPPPAFEETECNNRHDYRKAYALELAVAQLRDICAVCGNPDCDQPVSFDGIPTHQAIKPAAIASDAGQGLVDS